MTGSKFHTHDQQILDTTIQNLITQATWHPGFVHLCNTVKKIISNSYKFYLKHTENWYTYITANPCHLQGLPFFKNSTNSKIILLDVKTSQKKNGVMGTQKYRMCQYTMQCLIKTKTSALVFGMMSVIRIKVVRVTE